MNWTLKRLDLTDIIHKDKLSSMTKDTRGVNFYMNWLTNCDAIMQFPACMRFISPTFFQNTIKRRQGIQNLKAQVQYEFLFCIHHNFLKLVILKTTASLYIHQSSVHHIHISCHVYIHDTYVFIQLAMQRLVLTRNTCELTGENTYIILSSY